MLYWKCYINSRFYVGSQYGRKYVVHGHNKIAKMYDTVKWGWKIHKICGTNRVRVKVDDGGGGNNDYKNHNSFKLLKLDISYLEIGEGGWITNLHHINSRLDSRVDGRIGEEEEVVLWS